MSSLSFSYSGSIPMTVMARNKATTRYAASIERLNDAYRQVYFASERGIDFTWRAVFNSTFRNGSSRFPSFFCRTENEPTMTTRTTTEEGDEKKDHERSRGRRGWGKAKFCSELALSSTIHGLSAISS